MFKDKPSKIFLIFVLMISIIQIAVFFLAEITYAEDKNAGMWWTKEACAQKCGIMLADNENAAPNYQSWPTGCIDSTVKNEQGLVLCNVPPPEVTLKVPFFDSKGEEVGGKSSPVRGISGWVVMAFNWSVMVLTSLAVVMIMWAGFQWITAAGNASTIGKAKERITNAIMALILVFGSFILLRLINPALVQLVDIKVSMIPTILQATQSCIAPAESPDTMYALVEGNPDPSKITSYPTGAKQTICGQEYYIENSGEQTCTGVFCDGDKNYCVLDSTFTGKEDRKFICSNDLCAKLGKEDPEDCLKEICNSTDKSALNASGCQSNPSGYNGCCNEFSSPPENKQYCYYVADFDFNDGCVFVDLSGDKCNDITECSKYGEVKVGEGYWYGDMPVNKDPELHKSVCEQDACKRGCVFAYNSCLSKGDAGISTPNCVSYWEGSPNCNGNCAGIETSGILTTQCQDASPQLVGLLKCLKTKFQDVYGKLYITSISDDAGLHNCRDNKPFPSACQHEENSCHYGGDSHTDGSYAVDISCTSGRLTDAGIHETFRAVAGNICGGQLLDECGTKNHYHVSAPGCR